MTLFYPTKDLTLPMSTTASAIMIAQVFSAPVAAGLMALHGAAGLSGWQWIAVVEGGATVAVGVSLRLLLPPSPAHMKGLSAGEVAWVAANVTKCASRVTEPDGAAAQLTARRKAPPTVAACSPRVPAAERL